MPNPENKSSHLPAESNIPREGVRDKFSRESMVSRIAVDNQEEEKKLLKFFKESVFENQLMGPLEREKTPEELELIKQLNARLKSFVEGYGGEWIEIPPQNIHILDVKKLEQQEESVREKFKKMIDGHAGEVRLQTQSIEIFQDSPKLKFVAILIHEMLHYNSFTSFQKLVSKKMGDRRLVPRRSGFSVSTKGGLPYFNELNEAVIVSLQQRFGWLNLDDLDFVKEDYKNLEMMRRRLAVDKDKDWRDLAGEIEYIDTSDPTDWKLRKYSYANERKMLWTIINEIYNRNKDKFENTEEIFRIFAEAAMSGKLLPVARLIEKTFGKGTFRTFGELTKMASKKEK